MSPEPSFFITELIANAILELVAIRASCKLLDIRQPIIFGTAIYVLLLTSFALKDSGSATTLSRLLIGLSSTFAIPIAMSSRSLRSRILRSLFVLMGLAIAEFSAQLVYSLSTGRGNYPEEASQAPIVAVIMSYIAAIYMTYIAFEAVILICNRTRFEINPSLELPIILLNAWSYLILFALSTRVHNTKINNPRLAVTTLVAIIGTLSISMATLEIAQRDAIATKEYADRTALMRQVRHIKSELSGIISRSIRIRQLRHDLANQIETVVELLAQGQVGTASQYVTQLQNRASNLIEGESSGELDAHTR